MMMINKHYIYYYHRDQKYEACKAEVVGCNSRIDQCCAYKMKFTYLHRLIWIHLQQSCVVYPFPHKCFIPSTNICLYVRYAQGGKCLLLSLSSDRASPSIK